VTEKKDISKQKGIGSFLSSGSDGGEDEEEDDEDEDDDGGVREVAGKEGRKGRSMFLNSSWSSPSSMLASHGISAGHGGLGRGESASLPDYASVPAMNIVLQGKNTFCLITRTFAIFLPYFILCSRWF
jgi:hypothetical protein